MKEDHIRNGQLKPEYIVNVATSEEFIVGNYISADRNDVHTMIPFMDYLKGYHQIKRVSVDSGYESEENYCYFENLPGIELYVKPSNYEQLKRRKYRTDISRRENMAYDERCNTYTCANKKKLTFDYNIKLKTSIGYRTRGFCWVPVRIVATLNYKWGIIMEHQLIFLVLSERFLH